MFGSSQSSPFAEIDASTLEARLAESPTILDVREDYEVSAGHIPGALLIPMGQVVARREELPQDREIVVVCRSGARSASVCMQLKELGYDAINLRGGMLGWRGPVERA